MSTENIDAILAKLDSLTNQNARLYEMIEETNKKIDGLDTIHIKNGGGRDIAFRRGEFFQMLYDRPKEQFNSVSDYSKKAGNIFDVLLKVASIIALVFAAAKLGG